MQPAILDLNRLVTEVARLLVAAFIGEHITLVLKLEPGAVAIKADPGQLEQVLINLAVNARDAMEGGGTLTISTARVALDEAFARVHLSLKPGAYVALTVSDTGTGMDEATKRRVFEPFFTTKPVGKGTGMGLATVFGIRQPERWFNLGVQRARLRYRFQGVPAPGPRRCRRSARAEDF